MPHRDVLAAGADRGAGQSRDRLGALTGGTFTAPTLISELDTTVDEGWPALTSDELEIFYTSYGAAATSTQLQHASRNAKTDPWTPLGAPPELDAPGAQDDDATLSSDGRTLVFSSDRNGGNFELYVATRSCGI